MRFVLCGLVSYILAAPLTSRISLDLTRTEWTHIMTYVWWGASWFVWAIIAFVAMILIAAPTK